MRSDGVGCHESVPLTLPIGSVSWSEERLDDDADAETRIRVAAVSDEEAQRR